MKEDSYVGGKCLEILIFYFRIKHIVCANVACNVAVQSEPSLPRQHGHHVPAARCGVLCHRLRENLLQVHVCGQ